MNNVFLSKWKHENLVLYTAIVLCFILISFYNLSSGVSMSSDSERFSRWADDLIRFNFNLYEFYSLAKDPHRPPLFFFQFQ